MGTKPIDRQKIEAEAREQLRKLTWLRPGPIVDRHRTPWIEGNVSGLADWAERLVDEAVGDQGNLARDLALFLDRNDDEQNADERHALLEWAKKAGLLE